MASMRRHKQPQITWAQCNKADKYGWPARGRYHRLTRDTMGRLGELRGRCAFILDDDLLDAVGNCDWCATPITPDDGNRADYDADKRILSVMHYVCSWSAIMGRLHVQAFGETRVNDKNGVEYIMRPDGSRLLVT